VPVTDLTAVRQTHLLARSPLKLALELYQLGPKTGAHVITCLEPGDDASARGSSLAANASGMSIIAPAQALDAFCA
jgi:hypothetical protein